MILGTGAFKNILGNTYLIVVMLLCLCVSGWCWCYNETLSARSVPCWTADKYESCSLQYPSFDAVNYPPPLSVSSICPPVYEFRGFYYIRPYLTYPNCSTSSGCNTGNSSCQYTRVCSTLAEAEGDSVNCEIFGGVWDNGKCSPRSTACDLYRDDCESRGGVWDGQVVDDSLCSSTCDLCGTPESQAMREYIYNSCCEGGLTPQFTCGFSGPPSTVSGMIYSDILSMGCNTSNWETNKICDAFYNESSSSETSSSSSAQSSSSVSEYCLIFPNDLACICAADSTNPDCDYLRSSSSQAEPGSSGGGGDTSSDSGGGGTPSESSASGGVAGDDWEYDYRDSLHRIINATSLTARNTDSIEKHTGAIASILRSAKCLFEDCTNYDQLKVAFDSSIVIPDGDTAGVIGGMPPLDSNMLEFMIAAEQGDIYGIGPDSLNSAISEFGEKVEGIYADSGIGGDMREIADLQEDFFPTSQWSTGGCPTALSSPVTFNLPMVGNVNTGKSLGTFVCAPLPGGLGINLGDIVRAIIRLVVTITMAFGIFRTATGFKNE